MKKTIVILITAVLFTITSSYTQTLKSSLTKTQLTKNHQDLTKIGNDGNKEIVEFLLKYKGNNNTPTQKELNKLLANLGIQEIIHNTSMTKEVAFKLIDFYFKYLEENPPANSADFDKENSFLNNLSYINFRNQIKAVNPNATDLEIQKVFMEMHEKLKNL